jgi:hypothetical protein
MTWAANLAGHVAGKPHPRRAARRTPARPPIGQAGLGLGRSASWEVCAEGCGESGAATAADVRGVAVKEVAGQQLQLRNLVTGVLSNLG